MYGRRSGSVNIARSGRIQGLRHSERSRLSGGARDLPFPISVLAGYYELPNNFMKPNSAYPPRQAQLAVKLIY